MKKIVYIILLGIVTLSSCDEDADSFSFDNSGVSTSGSIAKFYIEQDHLFVIEEGSLSVFDISNTTSVSRLSKTFVNREVETISKLGDVLFLGTTTGVLFYDVTDAGSPKSISTYDHITGCDPVVSDGQYAYTTLRSGRNCGGGGNFLDIIDISDLRYPKLISSIQLVSPYGLAIVGDNLFVGEGREGMRWFDVSDKQNVKEIGRYADIKAIDFIPNGEELIVSTSESLLQMAYSDNDLRLISEIKYTR
ncbi:MAG: hypothetical protein OCD76_01100 [Reichenbachiella sp.]